jgi:hypothetical protein
MNPSGGSEYVGFRPSVISYISRVYCLAVSGVPRQTARCPALPHGESTDAHGFRNGAVAKIGGGIVFAESGEVEPLHHLGRTGEPLVAGTAHLDAELDAIPGHDSDQAAVRDVGSRHECDLCRSHREVQVEMVVAGDKIQHIGI